MQYKQIVFELISKAGISNPIVQEIKDDNMGDFAVPVFAYAKEQKQNPIEMAKRIANSIDLKNTPFGKVEGAAGYVNFFLNRQKFTQVVFDEVSKKQDSYFINKSQSGQVVGVDFSSVNLAKHFHIGHLRNTITGQAIAKFFESAGAKVVRYNYLGDYGTPFGYLIAASEKAKIGDLAKCNVDQLQKLYVDGKILAESDESFKSRGKEIARLIDIGDKEILEKLNKIKKVTLNNAQEIFDHFDIKFDSFDGEQYFSQFVKTHIKELQDKKLIKTSDGAQVVDLEEHGLGTVVIVSKEGYSLYIARDIAAAIERERRDKLDRLLYVVGSEQTLNFKQLFAILTAMNQSIAGKVKHIAHGLYRLEGGKISSRDGAKALLKDIIEETSRSALEVIKERGKGDKKEQEQLAKKIGRAALVFSVLSVSTMRSSVFDIKSILAFEGETGPYLLYTYARICSIFEKTSKEAIQNKEVEADENEFRLAKLLWQTSGIIDAVIKDFEPYYFAKHLIEIAKVFNIYYGQKRILDNPHRLFVAKQVQQVLYFGLELLGIETVEKM